MQKFAVRQFACRFLCSSICWSLFATLLAFLPTPSYAWPGKAIKVIDGDTLGIGDVLGAEFRIRLYGIDCPEAGQPEGAAATSATSLFTVDGILDVQEQYQDRNGRIIAIVAREDGMTVQELLLVYGLAWIDERYCKRSECAAWRLLEAFARLSGRGIWSHSTPIPPWRWRRGER